MKRIFILVALLLTIQHVKEHQIQCWSGPNSIYFYIIKHNTIWHYNFTNHLLSDDEMKTLFWKESKVCPIDTTEYEKLYVKTITEDKLHERIVRDLNK